MSKYTTEVRFICESKSGLTESVGCDNIDDVISKSWDKIFTTKVPFFDESYRSVICQKILKHYYLREICSETVGIWKLWMNIKLEEIMPYYNQLYESANIEFNPLYDIDLTRKNNRVIEGNNHENGETTNSKILNAITNGANDTNLKGNTEKNYTENSDETRKDLYSDTPQGALTNIENETYLTNARKITNTLNKTGNDNTDTTSNNKTEYNESNDTTEKNNGTITNSRTSNSTEDYIERITGKQGTESYSDLLNKFRETFLNIDLQVIEEFSELFFNLW